MLLLPVALRDRIVRHIGQHDVPYIGHRGEQARPLHGRARGARAGRRRRTRGQQGRLPGGLRGDGVLRTAALQD